MKSIYDFPDYKVTRDGRVISYRQDSSGKELKASPNNRGYPFVQLINDYDKKGFLVHRLVAEVFMREPKKGEQINHKNGIKTDNRVENLEWVTCRQNIIHSHKNGLVDFSTRSQPGSNHPNSKLTEEEVLEMRSANLLGCFSHKDFAEAYNLSAGTVGNILSRQCWKHI